VLSRNPALYSTRRLAEAAARRGHPLRVVDTLKCALVVETGRSTLVSGGAPLAGVDVAVPRIGASITARGVAVVAQLELMGVPVVNGSAAIARSRDKLRCVQDLAGAGVDVPRTVLARSPGDVAEALRLVGGLPVIVKLLRGTQGVGVMIARSEAEIRSLLDTMHELGQELVLQEFVGESEGRDVRVLVVGGRAVAAMRRRARAGEFRSNLHRGGAGEAVGLPPAYASIAERAARVTGLEVAGVDLLETTAGPRVIEVNSSPGFQGLERATGADIAGLIVEHAAARAANRATPDSP